MMITISWIRRAPRARSDIRSRKALLRLSRRARAEPVFLPPLQEEETQAQRARARRDNCSCCIAALRRGSNDQLLGL